MSKLYIVGTPIGNLEDITLRAIRVLNEASVIFCEDTRVTKKLLSRHEIKTPVRRLDANIEKTRAKEVVDRLAEGENVAFVTDAGTPGISDPGNRLVESVRQTLGDNIKIESIPGPSALTSALSISGMLADQFTFLGFLPHKKGRETIFKEITDSYRTVVFYESPHRIMKTLLRMTEILEDTRKVVVARELTKIYEESVSGSPQAVLEYFQENDDKVRGEFVVMVSGAGILYG